MDKEIREMSLRIVQIVNEYALPMECKRLVLLEILGSVEKEAEKVIAQQIEEKENAEGVHEDQLEK